MGNTCHSRVLECRRPAQRNVDKRNRRILKAIKDNTCHADNNKYRRSHCNKYGTVMLAGQSRRPARMRWVTECWG